MRADDWPELDGFDRDNALEQFTIYDRPLDYPEHYVVRRWFVRRGRDGELVGDNIVPDVVPRLAASLDEARALVPGWTVMSPRDPGDDAFIVETWL